MTEPNLPRTSGYRMPAEWEPHAATWLAWPHNAETWPGAGTLAAVEQTYLEIVAALVAGESVHILVNDGPTGQRVHTLCRERSIEEDRVVLHRIRTDDAWIRDYGPNFLVHASGSVAANVWGFDSWGGKYDWQWDDRAGMEIVRRVGCEVFEPGIVLEGGAIESNGRGVCLTTEPCLLNPNRNGGLSREVMETYLKDYLGVTQVIWLAGSLEGDDTDGHIDNLARFVDTDTVLCAYEENPNDPNHRGLLENRRRLDRATDAHGRPFTVRPLPLPGPVAPYGERLPASYANFYIGNRAVLLPVYGHANDARAEEILTDCFPGRTVVPIDGTQLVVGLGGIHCITQQQPA